MASSPDYGKAEAAKKTDKETKEHGEVLDHFRPRWRHARSHWTEWRNEARELYDMMAGRQWDPQDEAKMKEELRPMVTINVSGKYMDAVVGLQINNRQDIRYFPREMGDAKANELMTGAVAWSRELCNAPDEETDAFYDCIVTGMGWMEGYLDKDLDPEGVPAGRRVDPLEMFPDPGARMRNHEDARYMIRIRYMDKDDYEELFGKDYTPNDKEFEGLDIEDEEVELIETPQDYDNTPGASSDMQPKSKKCPVADYQWWRRENRVIVSHPEQGEKDLSEDEFKEYEDAITKLQQVAAAQGIQTQLQIKRVRRKVYYRALISNSQVGQYGLSPYQEGFTYHGITGRRDRNKNTWYGIGRAILDPQKWVNKFFSTILYTLMVNAKGGIMAEENTFKDSRKAESEWANPNSITWLKEGSLSAGSRPKLEPKPQAKYPEGLDRLMTFSMDALPQTSGLNMELLGLADRVQAGVVEAQRKQSAMAVIAWAFDAMRRYYRSMGRQMANYVKEYVPEGTLVMINGQESKQYVPLLKSAIAAKFDIIVDEAPTSVNMKERVWGVLETLIPNLLKAGVTIPPEVLDYSPIPTDLAQKWKESMKPDPQKQQLMQRKEQAEVAEIEAKGQEKMTGAELNKAQATKALADANQLPMDQNVEMQGEVQKAQIKADADMKIAQLKAEMEARTKMMIAEMEAAMEERIANMQMGIEAQLRGEEMQRADSIEQERMQRDSAIKNEQMERDSRQAERQMKVDSQIEGQRIKSQERTSNRATDSKERTAKAATKAKTASKPAK